jgi:hypothetical protein
MLAAASLLERRGDEVAVLASGETSAAAQRLGFEVESYRRSPDSDVRVAFEDQAALLTARMAGAEVALDARDVLDERRRPDLAVVDCMLPAAVAAMLGTGIAVAVTAIVLFGIGGLFGVGWEQRQIERYLRQRSEQLRSA